MKPCHQKSFYTAYQGGILTSILLTLVLIAHAYAAGSTRPDVIELGVTKSVHSKILAENRPYHIYLPPNYHSSSQSYPVIYLLDGDADRFKAFVGVLHALSTDTLGHQVEQAIVIAIPNTHRSRDLTPSVLPTWQFKGRTLETFDKTGQAKQFQRFLEQELMPAVAREYSASSTRVLVGESFGGLFAANVLLHGKSTFTDFLIIDPTALWDNDYLNHAFDNKPKAPSFNADVYFAFANNAHLGEIGLTNYAWGTSFADKVIKNSNQNATKHYFADETHGTVALLGWYQGLKYLLPFNQNKDN